MEFLNPNKEKQVRLIFIIVSIVIPVVVAALFKISVEGVDLSFLPPFYARLNAATAILLISALVAIKNQNQKLHRLLMRFHLPPWRNRGQLRFTIIIFLEKTRRNGLQRCTGLITL